MAKNKKKNQNRIKYDIRGGGLSTKGKKNRQWMTAEQLEYDKYKRLAEASGLSKREVFSPTRYRTVIAGDKARGRPGTPQNIVKRQNQEGLTDKEVISRYEAVKKLSPKKYNSLEDFSRRKGWQDIDAEIASLIEANPTLNATDLSLLITRTIFSPPME